MSEELIENTTSFFATDKVKELINNFINNSVNMEKKLEKDVDKKLANGIVSILKSIQNEPKKWDVNCPFSLLNKKDYLMRLLTSSAAFSTSEYIENLFIELYRFYKESEFNDPSAWDEHIGKFGEFVKLIDDGKIILSETGKSNFIYISYIMPAKIIQARLDNPDIKNVENFKNILEISKKQKYQWDKDFEEKTKMLKEFQDKLDDLKHQSNFVALDHGFEKLEKQKTKSLSISFISLFLVAGLILMPLVVEGLILYSAILSNQVAGFSPPEKAYKIDLTDYIYMITSILAIELILIYFFRVVLSNYNSLKAQVLQLELRRSLCQFIQSYADYAQDINQKSPGTLERFEQIIFSGISADPDKISTYDGVDQLANIIKAFKGKE